MKVLKRILKITAWFVAIVLLLVVICVLLLRVPAVQNYVAKKAIGYVTGKTHTAITLQRLYIAFPKSVVIEKLYAEDERHDTLLYVNKLEINISMLELLNKKVAVKNLLLDGAVAHIDRNTDSIFNFNFFIAAFSDSPAKPAKQKPAATPGKPWQIDIGEVTINNINAAFKDAIGGTEIGGHIGHLNLNMKAIDLQHLSFNGNELALSNTDVRFIQKKQGAEQPDTGIVLMPLLSLNQLTLDSVSFLFDNRVQNQTFSIQSGKAMLMPETIDLNKHVIKVKRLQLENSAAQIAMVKAGADTAKKEAVPGDTITAAGWQIAADEVQLKALRFKMDFTDVPKLGTGIDYNHLAASDINVAIKNAAYSPQKIEAAIENISLKEQSGFRLKKLSTNAVYDDRHAKLDNLVLITNNTQITRSVQVTYPSITSIAKNPAALGVQADFKNTKVGLADVLFFAPQLKEQAIFMDNRTRTILLNGVITGTVGDIIAQQLSVTVSDSTYLLLNAKIKGLPDALNAWYDVQFDTLRTTAGEIQLLSGKKIPANINLPPRIALGGRIKGSVKDAMAQLWLTTPVGTASIDATFKQTGRDTAYTVALQTQNLDIGYILKQPSMLGPVTLTANATGKNFSPQNLVADAQINIEAARLKQYTYHHILLNASADSNVYYAQLQVEDSSLLLTLQADASLVKQAEYIKAHIKLDGADLQRLNVVKDNIRTSATVDVDLTGPLDSLNGRVLMNNALVVKDETTYHIDSLLAVTTNNGKRRTLTVSSPVLDLKYDGNIALQDIGPAMVQHMNRYFTVNDSLAAVAATLDTTKEFKVSAQMHAHPLIAGVLLPGTDDFEGAEVKAVFKNNSFNLNANASAFAYKGTRASNIQADINSGSALNYSVSLDKLSTGPVKLSQTSVSGSIQNNIIDFALRIHDRDTIDKLLVGGNLQQDSLKAYVLHLDNKRLVINNEKWSLPDDNYIRFGSRGFTVNALVLENSSQYLSAQSRPGNNDQIDIQFRQFQLGTLSRIIEQDTAFIRGTLQGNVQLRNLTKNPAFVSALNVSNIYFIEKPVGNLEVKADNNTPDKYSLQASLTGFGNNVQVNGFYSTVNSGSLNITADIKKLNLATIEPFTAGQLRRSKGHLEGRATVTGATTKPVINSDIYFKDAEFNLAYINGYLKLRDEHISVDPSGIYFRSFTILDSLNQKAEVAGAIYTTDFKKMRFNVTATTNNFTLLNTTIRDNPLYFGKVILSSNIKVAGNQDLPIVTMDASLVDGSNIAVVIPSSKINTDRGEGIVVLTDTATINNMLSTKDTVRIVSQLKGIKLNAGLYVSPQTSFKLIVDKSSGDSLVVKGEARLNFSMNETGDQHLTGIYTLTGGSYKASFQKIIKRELKLQPGGTIIWNGTPLDATINLTAVYTVKTSPQDLLSSELAASTPEERNVYKNKLDFNVLMIMKGPLMKPEISFKLDMPESQQNAMGGTVYSRVTSLNNDPSELNKQVFALLVLGKFIPAGVGGGGGSDPNYTNAVTNIARNSVNQILTDQLNQLSGRFIKGVDLNVGISANDEYTSTGVTQSTQFSASIKKSFFKERLSVQVGTSVNVQNDNGAVKGADAQNLTGDIVLEYKINPDGSLRFKAFRQNQYEGIIDGQLYQTGVGIVFNRDYDKEKELFKTKKKKEKEKKEQEKKP